MAVRVEDTGGFVCVDLVDLAADFLGEARVFDWRICLELSEGFGLVRLVVDIEAEDRFCPVFEFGHFLP